MELLLMYFMFEIGLGVLIHLYKILGRNDARNTVGRSYKGAIGVLAFQTCYGQLLKLLGEQRPRSNEFTKKLLQRLPSLLSLLSIYLKMLNWKKPRVYKCDCRRATLPLPLLSLSD